MNNKALQWSLLAVTPAVLLGLTSCSSSPPPKPEATSSVVATQPGVPGGVMV